MKEGKISENRKMILDYIQENPGSHVRLISRELGMKMGTLRHHLRSLEKQNKITSRKERNLKTYFLAGTLGVEDKDVSSLFQQKRFKDIVMSVIQTPGSNHKTLSERIGLNPSSLSKYMRVLEERNIVYHEKTENEKRYYIVDRERIIRLLKTYRKSFWDQYVDNALELLFER